MLGRRVSDPYGAEEGGTEAGLDLLPVETELEMDKVTIQIEGRSFLGPAVAGYEIHMGRTDRVKDAGPFVIKEDGTKDGGRSGTRRRNVLSRSLRQRRFHGEVSHHGRRKPAIGSGVL